jgi:hypothetical protein
VNLTLWLDVNELSVSFASSWCAMESERSNTTTTSLSWVVQLQAHLRATAEQLLSDVSVRRRVLADAVFENPNAAEAWLEFLTHEESVVRPALLQPAGMGGTGKGGGSQLLHWYQKATELMHRSKAMAAAEAYVSVWIGYARHQW